MRRITLLVSVFVGNLAFGHALWFQAPGAFGSQLHQLPYGGVVDVSADGTAVLGFFDDGGGIWYPRTGQLTVLPDKGANLISRIDSISDDGTIVTGATL